MKKVLLRAVSSLAIVVLICWPLELLGIGQINRTIYHIAQVVVALLCVYVFDGIHLSWKLGIFAVLTITAARIGMMLIYSDFSLMDKAITSITYISEWFIITVLYLILYKVLCVIDGIRERRQEKKDLRDTQEFEPICKEVLATEEEGESVQQSV